MADDFQSSKVSANEQSSATKFNNFVQAVQDAINSLDNSNIDAAAAILVSKLAPGTNGYVLSTVAGVPTWIPSASSTVPTGVVAPFAGSTPPTDWLFCDGSAVSRTTYATLFGIVGTSYGVGDGATTFNLPDLRGRVSVGKGTNASVSTLGANDGVAVANRRAQHRHTPHSHTYDTRDGASGAGQAFRQGNNLLTAFATSSSDGGSGNANDSLDAPAYLVLNHIIKT